MEPGSADPGQIWSSFSRDPRVDANKQLRAGDRDRDLIRDAISQAYADGRLTQEEMDERLTQTLNARLLGDLVPVVADLIPVADVAPDRGLAYAGHDEIERLARMRYVERRRQALAAMVVPSVICLTIWIWSMISVGGPVFPWPIFVILGTGGYLSRLVVGRESALEEERDRLRKKQAQMLLRGRADPDESQREVDDGDSQGGPNQS